MSVLQIIKHLLGDTKAATAVEYGLIIAMIVIAMIASLQGLANGIIDMWGTVENEVTTSS